ncbi:MAG: hypothetical protein KatS3mg081_0786 [Gemmatimonadales bacterium]|nr:MAG: hypothetical protein KatS3mg081_0786 [Gemmatimonadales bacterium]
MDAESRTHILRAAIRLGTGYRRAALFIQLGVAVSLSACGPGPKNPVHEALQRRGSQSAIPSVAFRFSTTGTGDTRLYTLPRLEEAAWQFKTQGLKVNRVIGFSSEHDQIYLLTTDSALAVLDLSTGRVRIVQTGVVAAALGPTNRVHFVRRDGSMATLEHRSVTSWPDTLRVSPVGLWGTIGGRALAATGAGDRIEFQLISGGKPPTRRTLDARALAVARWGDIVAAGVDSGLVIFDPADPERVEFVELNPPPALVAVAPAEHRIYVADHRGVLTVLNRFDRRVTGRVRLPARAAELRPDPLGRILLVRPAQGDSLWVIDLIRNEVRATLPGRWRDDLPAVAPDGTILLLRGRDVVAVAADSFVVTGRVVGGAADLWLAAAWDPRRPALEIVSDTSAPPAAQPAQQEIFVQVSSTSNQLWAEDLARSLRQAGMEALVLPPSPEEDRYRVVLGPYRTREEAEAIGRKLGRSFWIFVRERPSPPPPQDEEPLGR